MAVSVVHLSSPTDACGLNGTTQPGFFAVANTTLSQNWTFTGPVGGCTISGAQALTPGFSVVSQYSGPTLCRGVADENCSYSIDYLVPSVYYVGPLSIEVN